MRRAVGSNSNPKHLDKCFIIVYYSPSVVQSQDFCRLSRSKGRVRDNVKSKVGFESVRYVQTREILFELLSKQSG